MSDSIEKQYLSILIFWSRAHDLAPGMYGSFQFQRIDLHNAICKKYGIEHQVCARLTDNLDKYIGFDYHKDYTDAEMDTLTDSFIKELKVLVKQKE